MLQLAILGSDEGVRMSAQNEFWRLMVNNFSCPQSLLFVPGSARNRFEKAIGSGADLICLDLEDAVAPAAKAAARHTVLDFIGECKASMQICVRVNRLNSLDGMEDCAALIRSGLSNVVVMLPKVETARDVELFASAFPSSPPIIALLESSLGVEAAFSIAKSRSVSALMFGSFDYSAETGADQGWDGLLMARSRIVAAAAAAGIGAIESPYSDLGDVDGAADEDRRSAALGMAGRAAIHPKLLGGIKDAFSPTVEELIQAREIVAAFEAAESGVARLGDKLVELPVILRMKRLLERAAS